MQCRMPDNVLSVLPHLAAAHRICNAVQEDMARAKLSLGYRDYCAHLLIPLNECRRASLYAPWKCGHERHVYEKCQYMEYMRRVKKHDGSKGDH